ncbi:hypothetical protein C0Z18_20675 [Trinickia dabaoshanensis]|uniref:Autotransporter domain-containing protein n=1 Tax=Trinickia dabaoshanensis TaxID=564714 RepID=A0A2N7VJA5_9BURK|nr:hypothetical protein C0Z18_20675 [Trinickia dabaoshanensis]
MSGTGGAGGGIDGGGAGGGVASALGLAGTLLRGGDGAGATSCETQSYLPGCGGKTQAVNASIGGTVTGQAGNAGAAGIGGGGGGAGAVVTSGNLVLGTGAAAAITGGAGGASGSAGAGGGGAGLVFLGGTLIAKGDANDDIHGGLGGAGTPASAGGGGGAGVFFRGNSFTFDSGGTNHLISGGYGGASGGSGGAGLIVGSDGAAIANLGGGNVGASGINGGYGAAGTGAIPDGRGGDGIDIYGSNNTLWNRGYINPGGSAGSAALATGVHVYGSGNTLVNANGGDIEGGWALADPSRTGPGGRAIRIDGNGNTLELQAGYIVSGKVAAAGGGNVLALGGPANGTFDLSKIVASLDETTGAEQYQGFAVYEKTGLGTWTVTGKVGDTHPWAVEQSTLALGANADLSEAANVGVDATLDASGILAGSTTVQSLSGASTGTVILGDKTLVIANGQGGGNPVEPGNFAGNITGSGRVEVAGGTQVLSGITTYQGSTLLDGGVLSVSADANLGTGGLVFNGGTLENTAAVGTARTVELDAGGGTLKTDAPLTLSGTISGAGGLTKTGPGTLTLTGAGTYTGPTTLSNGTLAIGDGFDSSLTSAIVDNATLEFDDGNSFSYAGALSGRGNVMQNGPGTVVLSGNSAGFAGATTINAGTLVVGGTLGGALAVDGGTLTGTGTLAGDVSIGTGVLSGRQGDVLTFGGNLTLSNGASIDVALGTPDRSAGLFNVAGNLTLGGTVNVTDLGGFDIGIYRLFDYTGSLANNGVAIGTVPDGVGANALSLQSSIAHQVNLVSTGGVPLNFWDGGDTAKHNNGAVDGGTGTWNAANENWTSADGTVNAAWKNGQFAIFAGQPGTVTVDNSAGALSIDGIQFAADGYRIDGAAIELGNAKTLIRTGAGGGALASSITATIAAALTGPGGLKKIDDGTLVLSGNNSYTGGTFVNGGTLSISSDANLGAASGAVAIDGGTLRNTAAFASARTMTLGPGGAQFDDEADLELAGKIGGAGDLVKRGSGTLTLGADNLYSGGTEISAGTLQLGTGGTTGSIQGKIDDDGHLVLNHAGTWTLSGDIGGAGTVTQAGSGTVVLTGNNTYRGGTTISAGTLQLGDGDTSGSIAGDVIDNGTLALNRSDTVVFDGKIGGTGTIEQIGSGSTDLTGQSSAFAGTTAISRGTLSVDGALGGTVTVLAGGTLAGTGTVGTTTIASGATIAPGHSPGTLHISGDIRFDPGSIYLADILPNQSGDLIAASGRATIGGGTVQALKAAGVFAPGSQWTIVSAQGGVTGTFDALTQNMPFVDLSLAYDPSHVYLRSTRNGAAFCSAAQTRNQCAAGNGVQSLGQGNVLYDTLASEPDAASARAALDALSGEVYASQKSMMIDDSRVPRAAAIARVRSALAHRSDSAAATLDDTANGGPTVRADSGSAGFWAQGFGAWNQWNGDGNATTFERSLGGLLIGADVPAMNAWRFGVMAGAGNSRFESGARDSSGASVDGHLAAYGGAQWGALGLRFGIAYTWHDVDTHRTVAFPGFTHEMNAHYGASTLQGFGELGYRFESNTISFEPFVDLASIGLHTNGFTEEGGDASLTRASSHTNIAFGTIGLRGAKAYRLYGWTTTVHGELGWRHGFGNTTPLDTLAFAGGSPFTVAGVPIARDSASIDAGLDVALSKAATLGLSYGGQFAGHAQDYSVQATLGLAF